MRNGGSESAFEERNAIEAHHLSPRSLGERPGAGPLADAVRTLSNRPDPSVTPTSPSFLGFLGVFFGVHRRFGCTPRITGNPWRVHHAQHRVPARRPWRGAPGFPGERRERQTDGSAAGGHPHFFRQPHRLPERPATHHPASPDARSREPSPGTSAAGTRRPFRAPRVCKIAHQMLVEAGSGALPGRHRRRRMIGMSTDEHEGVPSKNADGPLPCVLPRTRPRLRLQRASGRTTAETASEHHHWARLQPD